MLGSMQLLLMPRAAAGTCCDVLQCRLSWQEQISVSQTSRPQLMLLHCCLTLPCLPACMLAHSSCTSCSVPARHQQPCMFRLEMQITLISSNPARQDPVHLLSHHLHMAPSEAARHLQQVAYVM